MREDAFRAFLVAYGYTSKSVSSRLSRARSVERRLGCDLDTLDLAEAAMPSLRMRLYVGSRAHHVVDNELNTARTYRRFREGHDAVFGTGAPVLSADLSDDGRWSPLVRVASTADLLALYGHLLAELRARKIIRTANSPVGDYGELLFCHAFGWQPSPSSHKAYDAADPLDHRRYQIKARRLSTGSTAQLGILRDLTGDGFDELAVVVFDDHLLVRRAALIPKAVVIGAASQQAWVNGHRVTMTQALWQHPDVRDVTDDLRLAAQSLP